MQKLSKTVLLAFLLFICLSLNAQNQRNEILNELRKEVPGKGRVNVYEDEAIKDVLGRNMAPPRTVYTKGDGITQYVKMRGFKIQVFSGNNQRTSKNEAYHKQDLINSAFPDQETVVLFESPFWRLRAGNFKSREEAASLLAEMRKTFPSFGKEMYVVIDEVKIPVDQLQQQ